VNRPMKLVAPLVAALAMAACNAGGTSNVPASAGNVPTVQSDWSGFRHVPQWAAKHQARGACPQVVGAVPSCLALIGNHINPLINGLTPSNIETRYNLPYKTNGSGTIVAIVDAYDQPNAESDLATYRSEFGLGTANFTKFNEYGEQSDYPPSCTESSGWCVEEDLDIEMVSASCPNCTIYLIEAEPSISGLETAETTAVTLGAHIVSNSWICYGSTNCGDTNFSTYFASPGVVYLAASGDAGYNENGAPEALGNLVAVGGTDLSVSGSQYTETVWADAGGGCSNNGSGEGIAKPSWQKDPSCTYRTDADVSAVACICVAEYDSNEGGWFEVGGTSVASPINAGVFGLAGNASSQTAAKAFWSARSHKRNKNLHYISSGADGSCDSSYLCTAGTKQYHTYAGPIGWGTPNGIKLY